MINVGVIQSCPDVDFLEAGVEIDEPRLRALDGSLDVEAIRTNLAPITVICRAGPEAGPIGAVAQRNRFHWLGSPRSTNLQMSPPPPGGHDGPPAAVGPAVRTT